jgi:hypothetical protein
MSQAGLIAGVVLLVMLTFMVGLPHPVRQGRLRVFRPHTIAVTLHTPRHYLNHTI